MRQRLSRLTGGRIQYRTEGRSGIAVLGYRDYVGGNWEEMGKLQLSFLKDHGLRPDSVLLDIACGSLRGGVHFITYLEPGNYLGIDQEQELIDLGVEKELGRQVVAEKRPEFVVSQNFEFSRFSKAPDLSFAQSLFTHLTAADIELCLRNLREVAGPEHQFFATFGNGDSNVNPGNSHAHKGFWYTPAELDAIAVSHGWDSSHIGDWGHPNGQEMMQFTAI